MAKKIQLAITIFMVNKIIISSRIIYGDDLEKHDEFHKLFWLLKHIQSDAILPVHNAKHLFANILRSLQCSDLHKVLVAPCTGKLVVTPRVVDGEQRQVVAFRLVEFGLLLIGKSLLVLYDRDSKRCRPTQQYH